MPGNRQGQGPDIAGLAGMAGSFLKTISQEMRGDVQVEDERLAKDFVASVDALIKEIRRLRAVQEKLGAAVEQQTAVMDALREQMHDDSRRRIPR
jgi:N-methylhydantoinase B/oxoprolinase/acetone carboxylase alpha subunit